MTRRTCPGLFWTPAVTGCCWLLFALAAPPVRCQENGSDKVAGDLDAAFTSEVLPIFRRRCVECHGLTKKSAGLRLTSHELALKGSRKGAVIKPGDSAGSKLVERLEIEGKKRMPPEGDPLSTEEIDRIRHWIDRGARPGPASGDDPRTVEVTLKELPAGLAPVVAVAGDAAGRLLAVARGSLVLVHRLDAGKPVGLLAALRGHGDIVQCLEFSNDGTMLASGGFREVILWRTEGDGDASWSELRRLAPHADRVLSLSFSHDGKQLAAGSGLPSLSGEVKIWDTANGELLKDFEEAHSDAVYSVQFNPDSTQLATASADRMVHVLEVSSGKRLARFEGHTHYVLSLAYSPDGKRLVSGGADNLLKSWDLEKQTKLKDWNGHGKAVTAVAYSPDGKFLASVSGDRTLRIWDGDGKQLRSFGDATDYLYGVTVFGGGKWIAATGADQVVRIYDAAKNTLAGTLEPGPLPRGEIRGF